MGGEKMRPVLARGIADPRRLNRRVSTVQIQSAPAARPILVQLSRDPPETGSRLATIAMAWSIQTGIPACPKKVAAE